MGHFEKGKWINNPVWVINWSYCNPRKHKFESIGEAEEYIAYLKSLEKDVVIEEESIQFLPGETIFNIRMYKLL
jgi:hypothetical protein